MLKRALALFRRATGADRPGWDGCAQAGVLLIDLGGNIVSTSEGFSALLGAPSARLSGRPAAGLFRAADQARFIRALSIGAAAGRFRLETDPAAGPVRAFDAAVAIRADGRRSLLLIPVAELAGADAALRAEAEAAREEARARADLLADLSHEMRTPLNAVIGFAGAMQAEMYGPLGHPKYEEYAGHIRNSGQHLLDLVNSILDLARIEADRFALKRESVDAGRLAEECAGMVRLAAENAGLTLAVEIAGDMPQSFLDPRAVRQIVLNLLSNAVKFTASGGVTLTAGTENDSILITVRDTGVGMSEAEIRKLGARFTAAHGEGVRGAKGAGLGLALAFALAELHGGSMTLKSAPGEGLTAEVRLPIVAPAAPRRRRASAQEGALNANPALLTQLERIEAYRRERASAA